MARIYQIGFETGTITEWGNGVTATVTGDATAVDTTTVRSGTYSYKVSYSTTASTTGRAGMITLNTGPTNTLFCRFYLNITTIPNERSQLIRTWNVTTGLGTRGSLSINTDGSLQLYNGASTVGSASSPLTTNQWHRVEYSIICNGTNQVMSLLVDGVSVASGVSFANTNADYTVQFGWSATGTAGPTKTGTYYIDDVVFNYDAGGGQTGFPPTDSKLILLLPVADSAVGTGWTLGTGTATGGNAWAALDNIPPQGVADLTAGSDTKQVRNAAAAANSNLDLSIMDYAAAGIAAADTINAVSPLFYTGAPVATSAKAGSFQILSNPVGASVSLTQFYSGAAAGTFPTGWQIVVSTSAIVEGDIAAGNRSTRPVVRLQQVTSSTRIAMACLASLYVDYTPAALPPSAIALVGTPTSAAGASVTATTATVTVPAGNAGDLLIIGVAASSNATTSADAPLITASSGALTKLDGFDSVWLNSAVFYRFVQAGDASTYTFTLSSGAPEAVACVRYSGVSTIRYWGLNATTGSSTETASSLTFPAAGNVQASDVVVAFACMGGSTKSATVTTISTPSGWTQDTTQNGPLSSLAFPVTGAIYHRAAATDTPSVTGSTGQWVIQNVVLSATSDPVPDTPGGTISFVNASTVAGTAAGQANVVVNKPSGVVDGDVLLLAVTSTFLGVDTPPAGWTMLTAATGAYSHGTASNVYDAMTTVWYKVASGEGASYTIGLTTAQQTAAAIVAYRGTRLSSPVRMVGETNTNSGSATTTSPTPYMLPGVVATNLVVNFYTSGGDAAGTPSVTGPSGTWTQRASVASSVASVGNASIVVADKLGATDYPTASATAAQGWGVFSVALVGIAEVNQVLPHPRGPNYRR